MHMKIGRLSTGLSAWGFRGAGLVAVVALSLGGVTTWAETPADGSTPADVSSAAQSGRYTPPAAPCQLSSLGSPYIPVDSWMYVSLTRVYSLGYLDTAFLGLRPWTRASVIHMLEYTAADLEDALPGAATDEARDLHDALPRELNSDADGPCKAH